jgi:hypothetical protein
VLRHASNCSVYLAMPANPSALGSNSSDRKQCGRPGMLCKRDVDTKDYTHGVFKVPRAYPNHEPTDVLDQCSNRQGRTGGQNAHASIAQPVAVAALAACCMLCSTPA